MLGIIVRPRLASVSALFGPVCPLLVLLLPHVWTDLLLTAALLAAVAQLNAPQFGRLAQLSVLILLALATAARHLGGNTDVRSTGGLGDDWKADATGKSSRTLSIDAN